MDYIKRLSRNKDVDEREDTLGGWMDVKRTSHHALDLLDYHVLKYYIKFGNAESNLMTFLLGIR